MQCTQIYIYIKCFILHDLVVVPPQVALDPGRKSRPVVIVLVASHSIFRPVKISLEFSMFPKYIFRPGGLSIDITEVGGVAGNVTGFNVHFHIFSSALFATNVICPRHSIISIISFSSHCHH